MAKMKMRNDDCANDKVTFGENPSTRLCQTSKKVIRNITVEPVIFFYAIGHSVTSIITSSLYFDKICKVNYIMVLYLPRTN